MRIISGKHKGKKINVPGGIKARPTTDFAKESLFNILEHLVDFSSLEVLDLFAGTGNISYEFASRGVPSITSVDMALSSYKFINSFAFENEMPIKCIKNDVFKYLKKPGKSYDLVFADPPYALRDIPKLPDLIFSNGWVKENGIVIIEHGKETDFSNHPLLTNTRIYSRVNFSFFEASK